MAPSPHATTPETPTPTNTEQYRLTGDDVTTQVKRLVHAGNVRRVVVKSREGRTIAEFPLTVGAIFVVLLPVWAAIGVAVALVTGCSIEVEKRT